MMRATTASKVAVSDPLSGAAVATSLSPPPLPSQKKTFDKKFGHQRNTNKLSSQGSLLIVIALIISLCLFGSVSLWLPLEATILQQEKMSVGGADTVSSIKARSTGIRQNLKPSPPGIKSPVARETAAPPDDEPGVSVPECTSAPWKENENLAGTCPNNTLKPPPDSASLSTVSECATSCCKNPECVVWQYRSDTGCVQGADIRIGMEKDGTPRWCEASPPVEWQGQFVGTGSNEQQQQQRRMACSSDTWNPAEQPGQCFGLGDQKKGLPSESAEECRKACCNTTVKPCGAWQWNALVGCFYGKGMHGCQKTDGNSMVFKPFVGRRKRVASRTYTDGRGKIWEQGQ
mmetsp:Transcript_12732/g.15517  ORF Transcript_12732/g.15517 Transcript_12732/m.15517 type:complete len:346 (-) Transcript_12732:380-1417(-)|eukprot:CAMPEP_0194362856 /NCGR_PEP_ID=MMETSP0174-20130528/10705_1 /TAXON_ID=216777 /ORGANISM="Proboscia alata, Strain PI-D3" /LENGTH=345 /DNA_ID=CAMNT_0039136025 /DNA_START=75 /DNA_END=1112 /DNA_ORIENTATION=-